MPNPRRRLVALVCVAFAGLWTFILTSPSADVRVESKEDVVRVLPRTGLWFHEYRVTVRQQRATGNVSPGVATTDAGSDEDENSPPLTPADDETAANVERFTFRVTEDQYDALRTGERLTIQRLRLMNSLAWKSEESIMRGFVRALGARTVTYETPRFLAPSMGSASGLARVLSVHRVLPQRGALESSDASAPNHAVDIIVVEFWAPRVRTVVRTADVVNARSIDDLGPGQVLQMHFDPRTPRIMRLDDGMRSNPP